MRINDSVLISIIAGLLVFMLMLVFSRAKMWAAAVTAVCVGLLVLLVFAPTRARAEVVHLNDGWTQCEKGNPCNVIYLKKVHSPVTQEKTWFYFQLWDESEWMATRCKTKTSHNCYWNEKRGGKVSFVDIHGRRHLVTASL